MDSTKSGGTADDAPSSFFCYTEVLEVCTNYFVGAGVCSDAVGSAPTILNFTSRQLPLSFSSQTFMSRFSIFAWDLPGNTMSFGFWGTRSEEHTSELQSL